MRRDATRLKPGGAERLRSRLVEQLAGMARTGHRRCHRAQAPRNDEVLEPLRLTADRFPEQGGVVGELAVAEGRRDRDKVCGRLQFADVDLVELDGPSASMPTVSEVS